MEIFNGILIFFAIYSFAIASGVVSEKTGQLNIAINGMMLFGALFGIFGHVLFGYYGRQTGSLFASIGTLLFASLGGVLGSMLLSLAVLKFKADAGIAGTAINIIAPVILLVIAQSKAVKQKEWISVSGGFKINIPLFDSLNVLNLMCALIAILMLVILVFAFKKTRWGLRNEAVGDNTKASSFAGINIGRTRFLAMCLSGMLAGIAGGMVLFLESGAMLNSVGGIGFIALCMIAMSAWKIYYIPVITIVVGTLFSLVSYFTISSNKVPREVLEIIPFVLPLIMLPIFSRRVKAPRTLGVIEK